MARSNRFACLIAAMLTAALPAADVALPVQEYRLENGLTLLVLPRRHVPQVVCRITYRVGSVHERSGITGISHVLEHMMFKGTARIGVVDADRDAALMAGIDALVAEYRRRADAMPREALDACRRYEETPQGDPPEAWRAYEEMRAVFERLKAARAQQDENLKPEELWELYRAAGGTEINAGTGHDATSYFLKLPAGMEELFFWLESDRMEHAVFRQFEPERDVIIEERRQRIDDAPGGRFNERLNGIFFEAHPYRWSIIGYEDDIRRVTREDLERHYRTYYRPRHAFITIVGDVEPARCLELTRRYFGSLHSGPDVPAPAIGLPEDLGEKRLEAEAPAPDRVLFYHHTPPEGHPDSLPLDVAAEILSGASGRLHRRLVLEERAAVRTGAWNWTRRYAGVFMTYALAAPDADLKRIETLLDEALASLATAPPDDEEIQRAVLGFEAQFVKQLETLMGTSELIAHAHTVTSWRDIETYLLRLRRVTREDIVGAVRKHLSGARTVGVLRRAAR